MGLRNYYPFKDMLQNFLMLRLSNISYLSWCFDILICGIFQYELLEKWTLFRHHIIYYTMVKLQKQDFKMWLRGRNYSWKSKKPYENCCTQWRRKYEKCSYQIYSEIYCILASYVYTALNIMKRLSNFITFLWISRIWNQKLTIQS